MDHFMRFNSKKPLWHLTKHVHSRAFHPILYPPCFLAGKISPGSRFSAPARARWFNSFHVYPPPVSWSPAARNRLGTDIFNADAYLHFRSAHIWHVVTLKPQMDHRGLEAGSRPRFGCPPDTLTTMATPNKPTIYVAPATEDDYGQLVEWTHSILSRGDPIFDSIFPYPERASKDIPQTLEAFTNPSVKTFKAVLTRGSTGESDLMVGYVHITVQGEDWVEEQIAVGARDGAW